MNKNERLKIEELSDLENQLMALEEDMDRLNEKLSALSEYAKSANKITIELLTILNVSISTDMASDMQRAEGLSIEPLRVLKRAIIALMDKGNG